MVVCEYVYRRLNPTTHLLNGAASFCAHHDYVFALICMVNINMGVFDCISKGAVTADADAKDGGHTAAHVVTAAYTLLKDLMFVFNKMDAAKQMSVIKRVQSSGALPVARDTTSYNIVMSVLYGGATSGQLDYILKDILCDDIQENDLNVTLDNEELYWNSRSEAKRAHNERMEAQRQALLVATAEEKAPPTKASKQKEAKVRKAEWKLNRPLLW